MNALTINFLFSKVRCCTTLDKALLFLFAFFYNWDKCFSFSGLRPAILLKKTLWHRCFPVNFVKFLRTLFFTEHLWTIASSAIHILISFWMTLVSIENQKFQIIITIRPNTRMLSKFLSSNINRIVCSLYRCILVLDIKLFDSIFRELPKLIW